MCSTLILVRWDYAHFRSLSASFWRAINLDPPWLLMYAFAETLSVRTSTDWWNTWLLKWSSANRMALNSRTLIGMRVSWGDHRPWVGVLCSVALQPERLASVNNWTLCKVPYFFPWRTLASLVHQRRDFLTLNGTRTDMSCFWWTLNWNGRSNICRGWVCNLPHWRASRLEIIMPISLANVRRNEYLPTIPAALGIWFSRSCPEEETRSWNEYRWSSPDALSAGKIVASSWLNSPRICVAGDSSLSLEDLVWPGPMTGTGSRSHPSK